MKTIQTTIFGIEFPITNTPETLTECVTSAKSEDAVVNIFVSHTRFHRTNTSIRESVIEALPKITGVNRLTTTVKNKEGKDEEVPNEKPEAYFNRALADSKMTLADVAAPLQEAVGETEFVSVGEPRVGGPKTTKTDLTNAQTLINGGADKYNLAVSKLQQLNPGLEIATDANGVPTVESLAAALKTNRARVQAEENAALGLAA